MMDREPIKFAAHLVQGNEKISIEAKYASKFSLLIRFLNGHKADPGSVFSKLVFNRNAKEIMIGPCHYIAEPKQNGYQGRIVFSQDVYDLNSLFFENKLEKLQAEFVNLPLVLAHKDEVKKSFRDYIANLNFDLNVFKNLFDTIDARYADEPDIIRQHVQNAIIETEGRKFMAFLDEKLEEFENIIINYSKKEHERHGYYLRKQLWHFIICSPFMTRTNLKPRGYSGDSVMMKMIYDNKYEGNATFGKLMHKHPCEHPAAQAVRNRRDLVAKMLNKKKSIDQKAGSKKIKVLSVACGPAYEIQDVLTTAEDCSRFHFTLLDQDNTALSEAASQLNQLEEKLGAKIEAEFLNESVRTMLTTPKLDKMWGKFDYIYSMGLFDYLTTPVAKAVLEKLYQILRIGGEMAVGNFHISNPSRFYMEYWLDWVLYYRTEHEFMDLLKHVHSAGTKVLFEDTGSQMFLQVKKYEN